MTKTVEEWLNEWLEVYAKTNLAKRAYRCNDDSVKEIYQQIPEFILNRLQEANELEI